MGAWRETMRGVAFPWVCDQFGHMNVRWYAHAFDDGAFHLWSILGIGHKWMMERDIHTVTAHTATDFIFEVPAGALYVVESAFTRAGGKSVTFRHRMTNADTGELHARQECVEVFFDPATRKSVAMPDDIRAVVEANLVDDGED
ncbi:MAG: acyl-CoA thioesterase [Alphaproteobacteria bacterium]|nr:acyl-CoA thioesterase [Alphaproteobacteria bacterium]